MPRLVAPASPRSSSLARPSVLPPSPDTHRGLKAPRFSAGSSRAGSNRGLRDAREARDLGGGECGGARPVSSGGRRGTAARRGVRPAPLLHGLQQERSGGSSEKEEEGEGGVPPRGADRSERRGEAGRGGRRRRGGDRGAPRSGACHARRGAAGAAAGGALAGSACAGCSAASSAWWPPCWGSAGAAGTAPTSSWTAASAPPSAPRGPAARPSASKWSAAAATWWKLCSPPCCPTAPCPCEYGPRGSAHLAAVAAGLPARAALSRGGGCPEGEGRGGDARPWARGCASARPCSLPREQAEPLRADYSPGPAFKSILKSLVWGLCVWGGGVGCFLCLVWKLLLPFWSSWGSWAYPAVNCMLQCTVV